MPPTLVDPAHQTHIIGPDDHVVFSVVRNETLRLPYFLTHYRAIGFDRFIVIDNDSDDGTSELLRAQPDVTLYHTADSYKSSYYGVNWATPILDAHCQDRWVMYADADELLVWPGSEHESIGDLTARLDELQVTGLFAIMLDMYANRSFGDVGYVQGESFLPFTPFFDRGPYGVAGHVRFPHHMIYGGPRARTFRELKDAQPYPPAASKVPLVRWHQGQEFHGGCHTLAVPVALAPMRGALLHFKMLDDIPARCEEEVKRGEHSVDAREYKALGLAIERAPNRSFFDPRCSVRYAGTEQLVALGLMHAHDPFGDLEPWTGLIE